MAIQTTIPLSRLEMELEKTLNEWADLGETVVVEMPDQRLLAIPPLEPEEDNPLVDILMVGGRDVKKGWLGEGVFQDGGFEFSSLFLFTVQ